MKVAITGIGSLPSIDSADAVRTVARTTPDLPYWPQLPRRAGAEGMIRQVLGEGFHHLETVRGQSRYRVRSGEEKAFAAYLARADGVPHPSCAAGFEAFLAALEAGEFSAAHALKFQLAAPITIATCLATAETPSDQPSWTELLAGLVTRTALAIAAALRPFQLPLLFVLDEPVLGQIPPLSSSARVALGGILQAIRPAAQVGIHVCSTPPWRLLADLEPDYVFFDAHRDLESTVRDADAQTWMRSGGVLGLGLVPTHGDPESLSFTLERTLRSLERLPSPPRILVTPSCGLALTEPDRVDPIFTRCRALADGLAQSGFES